MSRRVSTLKAIRRFSLALAFVLAMVHADGAAAFWQTGGTGITALEPVAKHAPLRVNPNAVPSALVPGGPAQRLAGDFDNTGSGPLHVGTVVASIASVTKAPGAAAGSCDRSDFELADRVMNVAGDVHSGHGTGHWSGATISFRNKSGVDQNACMGASVKLRYTTT